MIWTKISPWAALACAGYGLVTGNADWVLWAVFMMLSNMYWQRERHGRDEAVDALWKIRECAIHWRRTRDPEHAIFSLGESAELGLRRAGAWVERSSDDPTS